MGREIRTIRVGYSALGAAMIYGLHGPWFAIATFFIGMIVGGWVPPRH